MSDPQTFRVSKDDGPLILAIPSKGRLQENAAAFFARAGLKLVQPTGSRDYTGRLAGVPGVEVRYLSASEIASQLASGAVHLGVTGEDLLRERLPDLDSRVEMLTPLGFGQATVVVAVPQAWIDVRVMSDLDEVAVAMRLKNGRRLRVATKYANLTRRFFAESGVADYRIVESLGATEGSPAAGSADIIVDITTTGATLAANALKVLDDGVILRSEANLVASLTAPWASSHRRLIRTVLGRITAEERARTISEVRVVGGLPPSTELQPVLDFHKATIVSLSAETIIHCPTDATFDLCEKLVEIGAETATVRKLDYVFCIDDGLATSLLERLSRSQA